MAIAKLIQGQRKGKGIAGVGIVLWLMAYGGYAPDDCCGNQTIRIEGYRKFTNEQIVNLMGVMVEKHIRGKIIYVAEADRAFPPRMWHEKKQTHALIGVQQDEKLLNWLIFDTHWRGVDVLLDDAVTYELIPEYRPDQDCVNLQVIGMRDMIPHFPMTLNHVSSLVLPYYDTHEPVE